MPHKKTKKEIVRFAGFMVKHEQDFIDEFEGNRNPQIVEMVNEAKGKVSALKDIIEFANRRRL